MEIGQYSWDIYKEYSPKRMVIEDEVTIVSFKKTALEIGNGQGNL
jgi:hypothetical protein